MHTLGVHTVAWFSFSLPSSHFDNNFPFFFFGMCTFTSLFYSVVHFIADVFICSLLFQFFLIEAIICLSFLLFVFSFVCTCRWGCCRSRCCCCYCYCCCFCYCVCCHIFYYSTSSTTTTTNTITITAADATITSTSTINTIPRIFLVVYMHL